MKKIYLKLSILLFSIIIMIFLFIRIIQSPPPSFTKSPLSETNTEFSLNLYEKLSLEKGNLFFSPYSIASVLSMACQGAQGATAKEISDALCIKDKLADMPVDFKNLNAYLSSSAKTGNNNLIIANALCLSSSSVNADLEKKWQNFYRAEIFSADTVRINKWFSEKTASKINNVVGQIPAAASCIFLNAAYFNGTWQKKFEKKATSKENFTIAPGKQIKTLFMHQTSEFKFIAEEKFSAISIPYKGNMLSLVIFLPENYDYETFRDIPISEFEKNLTSVNMKKWLSKIDEAPSFKLKISIPKISFKTESGLIPVLKELGVNSAFNPALADFTKMTLKNEKLYISEISHASFLKIDEEGTEAATASRLIACKTNMANLLKTEFKADHPFVFLIRDNRTNTILFMGRLVNPEAIQNE